MADTELLRKVVDFKRKFYPRAWARYDLAHLGDIRLMPPEHSMKPLADDYTQMREMLYGVRPAWQEILAGLQKLEETINNNGNHCCPVKTLEAQGESSENHGKN
ncbi:MAG: hypothetical protein IJJ33_05290 [Victivallales bacterium]|nr:hypothetical protein [Victivallales bacterium]